MAEKFRRMEETDLSSVCSVYVLSWFPYEV